MALEQAQEFRNTTQGWLTVVKLNPRSGDREPYAIPAGDTVWLTEDEQQVTANAPRQAKDNPFLLRAFKEYDMETQEIVAEGERAPLELVTERRDIPMRPIGSRASGEEVGVPGV